MGVQPFDHLPEKVQAGYIHVLDPPHIDDHPDRSIQVREHFGKQAVGGAEEQVSAQFDVNDTVTVSLQ
jgi:hypothetical protein